MRAAKFELLRLAAAESAKVSLLSGGFPQTYLERDVRAISSIRDLKVYFVDSGLACHLLGIDSETTLVVPRLGESLLRLARAVNRYEVQSVVIYRRAAGGQGSAALLPGGRALWVAA